MAIFKMKSLAQSHALEDAERDYHVAVRVEQFRVSDRAIYFAAFPGTQYIPFDALSQVKVRNTALSVTGTCGKQLPMVCLRASYDGEFYKDFLFEKRAVAEKVLDRIRAARPDLPMDVCGPRQGFLDKKTV